MKNRESAALLLYPCCNYPCQDIRALELIWPTVLSYVPAVPTRRRLMSVKNPRHKIWIAGACGAARRCPALLPAASLNRVVRQPISVHKLQLQGITRNKRVIFLVIFHGWPCGTPESTGCGLFVYTWSMADTYEDKNGKSRIVFWNNDIYSNNIQV